MYISAIGRMLVLKALVTRLLFPKKIDSRGLTKPPPYTFKFKMFIFTLKYSMIH